MDEKPAVERHSDDERTFIENMKRLREERGWTQTDLARKMVAAGWENYTQMTISRTEKHERPLRLSEAQSLAEIFGTPLVKMMAPSETRAKIDGWLDDIQRFRDAYLSIRDAVTVLVTHRPALEASTELVSTLDVSWANEGLREAFGVSMSTAKGYLERSPEEVCNMAIHDVHVGLYGEEAANGQYQEEG